MEVKHYMQNDITLDLNIQQTKTRNYSLDLLRIISMIMIVFLHIVSHGELNKISEGFSINLIIIYFIETFCIVAVNIYVLISGYFLINDKFRISKLIRLFLEVFFYSILIFVYLIIKDNHLFTIEEYLAIFLPISYKEYWFISAYFGLYLMSPILNILIKHINKKQHLSICIIMLLLFSLYSDILPFSDTFNVSKGYSLWWFIVVYFIASYIRKYMDLNKIKKPFLSYTITCILMFISWILLKFLSQKIQVLNDYNVSSYYLRYNCILNIFASIFLFVFFLKIDIKNLFVTKIIKFVSPLTLGIYLISDNPYLRDIIWLNIFKTNTLQNNYLLIPTVIGMVVLISILCLCIDYLRKLLFHLFDNRRWFKKSMQRIDDFVWHLYKN